MIKKGTRVRFVDDECNREAHQRMPWCYPAPGKEGIVADDPFSEETPLRHPLPPDSVWVDWGANSGTMRPFVWAAYEDRLQVESPTLDELVRPVTEAVLAEGGDAEDQAISLTAFILEVTELLHQEGQSDGTK